MTEIERRRLRARLYLLLELVEELEDQAAGLANEAGLPALLGNLGEIREALFDTGAMFGLWLDATDGEAPPSDR